MSDQNKQINTASAKKNDGSILTDASSSIKPGARLRIAALASGAGSNLQAIMDAISDGRLNAELCFVVSNNSKSGALEKARNFGCATYHLSEKSEGSPEKLALRLCELAAQIDICVLCGYMKQLPDALLMALPNRIVNVHPALLPAFGGQGYYGSHVHEAVIKHQCWYSGVTFHMVNRNYDQGQIVLQRSIELPPDCDAETCSKLVLQLEHAWYWQVIQGFAEKKIIPLSLDDGSTSQQVDATQFRLSLGTQI